MGNFSHPMRAQHAAGQWKWEIEKSNQILWIYSPAASRRAHQETLCDQSLFREVRGAHLPSEKCDQEWIQEANPSSEEWKLAIKIKMYSAPNCQKPPPQLAGTINQSIYICELLKGQKIAMVDSFPLLQDNCLHPLLGCNSFCLRLRRLGRWDISCH